VRLSKIVVFHACALQLFQIFKCILSVSSSKFYVSSEHVLFYIIQYFNHFNSTELSDAYDVGL